MIRFHGLNRYVQIRRILIDQYILDQFIFMVETERISSSILPWKKNHQTVGNKNEISNKWKYSLPANVPTARFNQQAHQVGNSVFTSASKGPNSRFHVNPFAPRKQDKLNRSIRTRSIASPLLSTLRFPWEPDSWKIFAWHLGSRAMVIYDALSTAR